MAEEGIPAIGAGWREALVRKRPVDSGGGRFQLSRLPSARGIADRQIQTLREAQKGVRNDTLNSLVFTRVVHGQWTDQVADACWDAALHCGLEEDEVARTIWSAEDAALEEWLWPLSWLGYASTLDLPADAFDAAVIIAWKMVITGKERVGLAVRELSELLGISVGAASALLRTLCEHNLVRRIGSGNTRSPYVYQSLLPASFPTMNTHPSHNSSVSEGNIEGGVFTYGDLVRALDRIELGRHRAFQKIGEGPRLARAGISVLHCLQQGSGMTVLEVADRTATPRRRVERAIKDLHRAGLVAQGSAGWVVADRDVVRLLDEWAERKGIPDRAAMRTAMHEEHRRCREVDLRKRRKSWPAGQGEALDQWPTDSDCATGGQGE